MEIVGASIMKHLDAIQELQNVMLVDSANKRNIIFRQDGVIFIPHDVLPDTVYTSMMSGMKAQRSKTNVFRRENIARTTTTDEQRLQQLKDMSVKLRRSKATCQNQEEYERYLLTNRIDARKRKARQTEENTQIPTIQTSLVTGNIVRFDQPIQLEILSVDEPVIQVFSKIESQEEYKFVGPSIQILPDPITEKVSTHYVEVALSQIKLEEPAREVKQRLSPKEIEVIEMFVRQKFSKILTTKLLLDYQGIHDKLTLKSELNLKLHINDESLLQKFQLKLKEFNIQLI